MKRILFFLIAIFLSQNTVAQKGKYQEVEMITHPVQMGETIRTISQKYLVEPGEIYQFNKYAVNGIRPGMTLLIPVPVKDPIDTNQKTEKPKKPVVVQKPVEIVKPVVIAKPIVKTVITSTTKEVTTIDNINGKSHTVEPKETLYSLSKKFNISVEELKLANPALETSGVQIGLVLKIPGTKVLGENETSIGGPKAPIVEVKPKTNTTINHTVVAKETFYSLSKKYSVSPEEIQKQNKEVLVNGLQIGLILTIKNN